MESIRRTSRATEGFDLRQVLCMAGSPDWVIHVDLTVRQPVPVYPNHPTCARTLVRRTETSTLEMRSIRPDMVQTAQWVFCIYFEILRTKGGTPVHRYQPPDS
jgi:hypothetical protein